MAGVVIFIALAFVVTLLYTGLGSGVNTDAQVQAKPIAYVNGYEITDRDLTAQYESILASGATGGLDLEQLRYIAFQDLVNYHLVIAAARSEGFEVSKAEIDQWIAAALPEGVTLRQFLNAFGMTENDFRQQVENYLLAVKIEEAKREEVTVDEEEVEALFNEMLADDSGRYDQVRARHILIRPADPDDEASWEAALEEIEALRGEILAGTPFEKIAAEQSHDTGSAILGGDLGFFGRGVMVQPFEEAAFSLEIGELSEPIRTDFGYHLIEVTAKRDLTDETYAESEKNRIRNSLHSQALQRHMTSWMDDLWANATIEILDIRLQAQQAHRDGDLEKAVSLFQAAIEQYRTPSLHVLLAQVYEELEEPELALEQYRIAAEKAPSDANILLALGLALMQADEREEAENVLVRASELAAQMTDLYQGVLIQLQVQQALTQLGADDDVLLEVNRRIQNIFGSPVAIDGDADAADEGVETE